VKAKSIRLEIVKNSISITLPLVALPVKSKVLIIRRMGIVPGATYTQKPIHPRRSFQTADGL